MHRMTVENEESQAAAVPQQATNEADHHLAGESLLEDHKGQTPLVGDRGDQIAAKPLARARNHRRLSTPPVTGPAWVVFSFAARQSAL
jgi:hypothetical protein